MWAAQAPSPPKLDIVPAAISGERSFSSPSSKRQERQPRRQSGKIFIFKMLDSGTLAKLIMGLFLFITHKI